VLPDGTRLAVRGALEGEWLPVVCAETDGYVASEFVTDAPDAEPTPPVTGNPATDVANTDAIEPVPTAGPTATEQIVEEPTLTAVPIVADLMGTVVGTGGEGVRCRVGPSTDAELIGVVSEGTRLIVRGGEADGWIPIICGDGQDGFVSAQFLAVDGMPPPTQAVQSIEPTPEEPEANETEVVELEPVPTEIPPTEAPVEQPYVVQRAADSEDSGTGYQAVDDDPGTIWSVYPSASPDDVWLRLDLGEVRPVDRLTFELGMWNALPAFEIWLSEDGDTWWNASRWNGWNLQPDVEYEESFGLWTRYVMIVVPDADESGLGEIGGFREIAIWPADDADSLNVLGAPVTPEPQPTEVPPETEPAAVEPELEQSAPEPEEPQPAPEETTDSTTDPAPAEIQTIEPEITPEESENGT